MQIFKHSTIGTHLEIFIKTSKNTEKFFDEICIFLDNFNQNYSRFIESNWLYGLNKNKKAYFISENEKNMLIFMQKLANETDGYFDPTIGKRLRELGYFNKNFSFDNQKFSHKNFDEIIKIQDDFVEIKENIELEFGGIGKGFLIDWLVDFLKKNFKNEEFLINFGGDMASLGKWKIALESPFDENQAIGIIELENSFLACSGTTRRKFKNSHHLINPFSGECATEIVASFIETSIHTKNGGMLTDGYATALFVMNFDFACKKFLDNPYINGVLIKNDKKFFITPHSKIQLFS